MSTMTIGMKWMTVQEVAERLGITDGRVRQLLLKNRLHGEKFGQLWVVNEDEVERFASLDRPPGNPGFKK